MKKNKWIKEEIKKAMWERDDSYKKAVVTKTAHI